MTEPFHTLDHLRKSFNGATNRADRSEIGQFLTPVSIARFMSSMFESGPREVRILDPGAGAGVLFSACVETLISQENHPLSINIVAYEKDSTILPYLEDTLKRFQSLAISKGMPADLAKELALYLNSTIADQYFRLFSGHTQVNATDLRKMPYPNHEQLLRLGAYVEETIPDQATIDAIIEKEFF